LKVKYSEDGDNTTTEQNAFISTPLRPEVFFEPQEVWEIRFGDITVSPMYLRGLVAEDRGLSLRFPRFMRRRDDKSIEEANSIEGMQFSFILFSDS
jgi:DNA ligase-1